MGELEVIRAASSALSGVTATTSTLISVIRRNGIVAAAERQRLRDHLTLLRREDISQHIARMGVVNINHTFYLYDLAESKVNMPQAYAAALSIAGDTVRLLEVNLHRLARELG